jgi:hypothetical protein
MTGEYLVLSFLRCESTKKNSFAVQQRFETTEKRPRNDREMAKTQRRKMGTATKNVQARIIFGCP